MSVDAPEAKTAPLAVDFLVIGAGVAGLSCAIALSRVGHRVLVVDKASSIPSNPPRGIRMPPNLTKILNAWQIGSRVFANGMVSQKVVMSRLETGWVLGGHVWDDEMIQESGGEFTFIEHERLRQTLLEIALELGARVRFNACVASIGVDGQSAVLTSGEILRADVTLGACGIHGPCRRAVVNNADDGKPTGLMMYSSVIAGRDMLSDPELAKLLEQDKVVQWVWFGDGHAALCFPIRVTGECALYFYAPDDGAPENYDDIVPLETVLHKVSTAEPRLQKLASLAPVSRIRVTARSPLEDWVHESGHLTLVGAAAHPYPPGAIFSAAMGLEDAAVLAKLFSHLHDKEQISSLLYAFQDLRQERCNRILAVDCGNIMFMTLPPGEMSAMRDRSMRERHDAGKDVLALDEDEDASASKWEENLIIFGYDAEDEADNWWVLWGLLRERAKGGDVRNLKGMRLSMRMR